MEVVIIKIILKYFKERVLTMINYYDDKKDLELVGSEGRTVAIYGAGKFIPYGFKDILPRADYFIDRNADAIKQINNTPVVTIEQFQRIKSRGGRGLRDYC